MQKCNTDKSSIVKLFVVFYDYVTENFASLEWSLDVLLYRSTEIK